MNHSSNNDFQIPNGRAMLGCAGVVIVIVVVLLSIMYTMCSLLGKL